MGKLDELRRLAAGNVDESMGVGRPARSDAGAPCTTSTPARWQGVVKSRDAALIPVDRIDRDPNQPREEFGEEALRRLADSLRDRGQLQPIRVRWDEGRGVYVVVVGERRWRAARMAGLPTMAAIITEGPIDAGELLSIQLVENALREDLKPVEQARAYRTLMDRNGWSVTQLARELAIDHSGVTRALALLDLPAPVQERVEHGDLPPATAYEISKADPAQQEALTERVIAGNLSRAEAIEEVRRSRAESRPTRAGKGQSRVRGRKVTTRTIRAAGCKVVVENRRGLDGATTLAALREAVALIEAELGPQGAQHPSEAA